MCSARLRFLLLLVVLCSQGVRAQWVERVTDPVQWVNPLMGTQSSFALSNGNTYPAIARPWGMNFWMPQTGKMGDGWAYSYDANRIRGFKQTHQPSPWINDYGQFSIMPVTGKLRWDEESRASWFSHKAEKASPHYYQVYLADHDVTAEITPTERAAVLKFTFPESRQSWIVVDAFDKGSSIKIIPSERKLIGYSTRNSGGVPDNFRNYFVMEFSKPFTISHTWHGKQLATDTLEYSADHVGAVLGFETTKGESVEVRVASSFISEDQAQLNLRREIGNKSFRQVQEDARTEWNRELGRIQVEGGTADQVRTFYSCLYRVLLFPRRFYELDESSRIMHYSPYNGQVLPGYMFTDNGFWDTFRAVFPFFTLMYPSLNSQIMEGLVNTYKESGWLPEWASPGHRDCMIGSNSASLIADSYLKGIRGYDIDVLYEALLKNSKQEGPLGSVGRKGAAFYNTLGYVPYDVQINENAARTLEYAYADYALMQLAKALKRPQAEIDTFARRAGNYRNLFDPETRLMRGRLRNGAFQYPFNPFKWGDAFTEGNSWHYTWSVFQDIEGLSRLMGGHQVMASMLDSVFRMAPVYDDSYYGFPIHEIREMQIMNMGQYAHGNQPIQHMVYLYNYVGQPWKTQQRVREIMDRLYQPTPDGYCGDEDNGQTSAWYVFSALGLYPVTPGSGQYVLGCPLFRKAVMKLENGKQVVLQAAGNGTGKPYVQSLKTNGQVYTKNWVDHRGLLKGMTLDFIMSEKPNLQRGTGVQDFPYSMTPAGSSSQKPAAREVIAYYTGDARSIEKYPVQQLTQIIFSFLHLKGADLGFDNDRQKETLRALSALKKKNPGLKVLVSLGGWGGCAPCSEVFSSESNRRQFAESVRKICEQYQVDGIDLDWEYPTIPGHPGHRYAPEDRNNFTSLVRILREVLGPDRELSFAAGGFTRFIEESVDWKAVMPYVNRVNLMTYDLVSGYSTITGHHTPLYGTGTQQESTDHCVQRLLSMGVPAEKMVIGSAFYARVWEQVDSTGGILGKSGKFKAFIPYREFSKQLHDPAAGFVLYRDQAAQAPYAYSASRKEFATFDDVMSVQKKVDYIKTFGLGGIMFWELTLDKPENGLLSEIHEAMRK